MVIQNSGVNEFVVSSLKTQLFVLPEIKKFYGLESSIKLLEMIALFQKLDTNKRMLAAEVIKLVKLTLLMPATNVKPSLNFACP